MPSSRAKLDTTPPVLVITNPASSTVQQPMIEVQGFCPEALASLTYSVSNAAGSLTNQPAVVLSQTFASNTAEFTTNAFQAFDVSLTNGANVLTFYATDRAGNVTVTNFTFTFNYSSMTNAPAMQIYWPQNGAIVSGTVFTLRGWVNDFTASVTAQITNSSGTNTVAGLVERNGLFWVQNAPLTSGTNHISLTAIDAVSNISTTNLTIICSNAAITIGDFTGQLGGYPRTNLSDVTGTITLTGYTLWVNGVQATQSSGTWQADSVPVGLGGTAVVEARAIPNSDNGGNGNGMVPPTDGTPSNPTGPGSIAAQMQIDQPAVWYIQKYYYNWNSTASQTTDNPGCPDTETYINNGQVNSSYYGGGTADSYLETSSSDCNGNNSGWQNYAYSWPASQSPVTQVYTDSDGNTNTGSTDLAAALDYAQGESYFGDTMLMAEWDSTEHAATQSSSGSSESDDTESIATQIELQTGGKGIPGAQSLFEIQIAATSYTSRITEEGAWTPYWNTQPIPPAQITVLGQSPGSDGMLPVILADNVTVDITPQAPPPRYFYSISPSGYPLSLTANDIDLSQTNPIFCVGQQITFQLNVSASYSNALVTWILPDTFVNNTWQLISSDTGLPYGSVNYDITNTLLSYTTTGAITTPCWYVNGTGGTVRVGASLMFANGKSVSVAAAGQFTIYRPSISNFSTVNPSFPASGRSFLWNGDVLSYGNTATGEHGLYWSVDVNSTYNGNFAIEQLVNAQYTQNYGWCPDCRDTLDTDGQFWLDGNTWNYTAIFAYVTNIIASHNIVLSDIPQADLWAFSPINIWMSGHFNDYLMFQPPGANSIFVTLATNGWSMNGEATETSGIILNSTPAPSNPQNDASFPTWTENQPE
jgi:hypothetical protein